MFWTPLLLWCGSTIAYMMEWLVRLLYLPRIVNKDSSFFNHSALTKYEKSMVISNKLSTQVKIN